MIGRRRFSSSRNIPGWVGLAATLLATVLAIGALAVVKQEFSDSIFFIPLAVVSISSVLFGLTSGLVATVISAVGIDYFVFHPAYKLLTYSLLDQVRLVVFVGISLLVTLVGAYARASRRRAEEAERRQRFLVDASLLLSESLEYEATLEKITQLAVPEFSDTCVIQLLGPSNAIESIKMACSHPGKRVLIEEYIKKYSSDLTGQSTMATAIRTGQSQIVTSLSDDWRRSHARDDLQLDRMRQLAGSSFVVVPLRDHGQSFGAIGFGSFSTRRRYDRRDLVFFEELGRRCSTAMLNASLFRETRRAIGARDDFISIASHELKTPLTSLYLHLRLLSRVYKKPLDRVALEITGTVSREIQQIERQADRLTFLVDQLLDLSRIRVGKLTLEKGVTDLVDVAGEVVRQFRETDDAPEIQFVGEQPIFGEWDRDRLEQVVSNLVSNAIKYGNRSSVEVRAECGGEPSGARLIVRDRGPGIPVEFQSKLFGRFERGPTSGGSGLGLGLYIVRQIVEAHGGKVEVDSQPGSGSTFTVLLPLKPEETVGSVAHPPTG